MLFELFKRPKPEKNADSSVFKRMLDGKMEDEEVKSSLLQLNTRGFGKEEILAAANALRERMTAFKGAEDAIDVCGTGGDQRGTLNVSTAVAFVLAGGGVRVAKHGNRAVSSHSGSTDVLVALGINTDVPAAVMQKALRETHFCYLAAPLYHPAMKYVAKARQELGVRTIFNLLGPLVNPARVKCQVIGVYDEAYLKIFPDILKELGSTHVYVVHGDDGLDEITTTAKTHIAELNEGQVSQRVFDATSMGIARTTLDALRGRDALYNAAQLKGLLQGEKGPYRDMVLVNAGAGFVVAGKAEYLLEGMKLAAQSIDSGQALKVLEKFVAITKEAA
ncbi:MAG: anthranilate phosphoribosyltransferase [Proteobacteria bacterium]|nr:anthranilate phosphoribosyltransferase [Pseudomonadota bacterium]